MVGAYFKIAVHGWEFIRILTVIGITIYINIQLMFVLLARAFAAQFDKHYTRFVGSWAYSELEAQGLQFLHLIMVVFKTYSDAWKFAFPNIYCISWDQLEMPYIFFIGPPRSAPCFVCTCIRSWEWLTSNRVENYILARMTSISPLKPHFRGDVKQVYNNLMCWALTNHHVFW